MPKTRVSSGVSGLDKILGGGYIQGRTALLAGGPGTGKSILSWHFLLDGISKGEHGVLLTLDQSSENIQDDMTDFGWDSRGAVKSKSLTILSGSMTLVPVEKGYEYVIGFDHPLLKEQPFTVARLASLVKQKAAETGAVRLVVDGLGPLLEVAGNRFEVRQTVYSFMREIITKNTTALLTHELKTGQDARSNEMPFFICDTVVKLDMVYSGGDFVRTMRVIKMRGSSHVMRPIIFKIGADGIVAFPDARLPD